MKLLRTKHAAQGHRNVQAVLESDQRASISTWKETAPKVDHDVVGLSIEKDLAVLSKIARSASGNDYTTLELKRLQVSLWLAFKNVTDEMTRIFQNIPMKQAARAIEKGSR